MNILPTYKHESYKCIRCQKGLAAESVRDTWRCPECTEPVAVFAEDFNGRRQILNRIMASELREHELRDHLAVVVPTSGLQYIHSIIAIEEEGASIRVALRGYKAVRFDPDDYVECALGPW